MKLAIVERPLEEMTQPNTPPLPGLLVWSRIDYYRRVAVYLIQHDDGVDVPVIDEISNI